MKVAASIIVGLVLVTLGHFQFSDGWETPDRPPGQAITPPAESVDLGELSVGKHEVTFDLSNGSARPIKVLGMEEVCGQNVCVSVSRPESVTVAARREFTYACEVNIQTPGPFSFPLALFVDDGGIRTVTLRAHGVGR